MIKWLDHYIIHDHIAKGILNIIEHGRTKPLIISRIVMPKISVSAPLLFSENDAISSKELTTGVDSI